jgi:riboflavin kinase/FMN adenylyltransferase
MKIVNNSVIKLENLKTGFFSNHNIMAVIGFFDGVHLGHKKIINECVERAKSKGGTSLAFTFDKPPVNIIRGRLDKKLIVSFSDKIKILKQSGLDYIIVAKFNRAFAQLSPQQFCSEILIDRLNVKEVFIGEDFRFGRDLSGDIEFFNNYFKNKDVSVNKIKILKIEGVNVSSTIIRKYYNDGDIDNVTKFLGRIPSIKGIVVHGDKRGRLLGFPTANIDVFEKYVTPKDGVYIGIVKILYRNNETKNHVELPAVINIGNNPTFSGKRKWLESHIIDFNENIYGKKIEVFFLKRLRDERTFIKGSDLVSQVKFDVKMTRNFFKNHPEINKL